MIKNLSRDMKYKNEQNLTSKNKSYKFLDDTYTVCD